MRRPSRPSPPLLLGIAAVVLASSGSAIAAKAITSKDIKNGTIALADLSPATKAALAGGRGPQGAPGPAGAAGAAGTGGGGGGAATQYTTRAAYTASGVATASCLAGEVATGGGAYGDDGGANTYTISQPDPTSGTPTGWYGVLRHRTDGSLSTGTVYVVCAR